MKKKMPKWIWAIIIPSVLMVAFFILIIVVGVSAYLKTDPLPDGFAKSHHSYEDMLEFAKTIDPDATVSENYVDQIKTDNQSVREWPATINGIDCVVASTPEMFFSQRGSAFTTTAYGMDTDYDQIVINMVLENYPELGEIRDNRYSYSMQSVSADDTDNPDEMVQSHPRSPVYSVVKLDSIDEETFDKLWDSYVKANQEYAMYNPTREYRLTISLPGEVYAYIHNTGDDQYQSAKEALFNRVSDEMNIGCLV